ncbi:hypothetical protein [Pseudomonas sp. MWU13-3659]|uniref:type III secretion apparatus assembly protein SctX n=1 Tax=Pseudomonas sp. MWU13-3659 TaxID=2986964 RepID=UPI002075993C|nr:hypothetical protein [Pseudomonas sp. MWU13-3659]
MSRIERGGQLHDLWQLPATEGERLPLPGRDPAPGIWGAPVEKHLPGLYPQHCTERQRFAFGDPSDCLSALSNPADFDLGLDEILRQCRDCSAPENREFRSLLHALNVDRRMLNETVKLLIKA